MIHVKPGVKLTGLQAPILLAVQAAEHIWWLHGETPLVITSANDGTHKPDSFHYAGRAVDLRSKTLPRASRDRAVAQLRNALGTEFDVLLEDPGGANEHVHVEHDPKG